MPGDHGRRTYYEVLGVKPTATAVEITAAHARLLHSAHRHANGVITPSWLVEDAYGVLSDPARRRAYDHALATTDRPSSPSDDTSPFHDDESTAESLWGQTSHPPTEGQELPLRRGVRRIVLALMVVVPVTILAFTMALNRGETPESQVESQQPTDDQQPDTEFIPEVGSSPYDLSVGTCFKPLSSSAEVRVVDCAEPHDYEVYAVFSIPLEKDATYPADDIGRFAWVACRSDAFSDYTGQNDLATDLVIRNIYPSEESWANGDREVVCAVGDSDGLTVGSLKGNSNDL